MVKVKIINKLGLHARSSASFVKEASKFESEIFVIKGDNKVNGKSIMGLLTLAAAYGDEITIDAQGSDAQEAIKSLTNLVNSGFNEE